MKYLSKDPVRLYATYNDDISCEVSSIDFELYTATLRHYSPEEDRDAMFKEGFNYFKDIDLDELEVRDAEGKVVEFQRLVL